MYSSSAGIAENFLMETTHRVSIAKSVGSVVPQKAAAAPQLSVVLVNYHQQYDQLGMCRAHLCLSHDNKSLGIFHGGTCRGHSIIASQMEENIQFSEQIDSCLEFCKKEGLLGIKNEATSSFFKVSLSFTDIEL